MSPRLQRVLEAARVFYLEHAAEHGIDPAPEVWSARTVKRGRSTYVYLWTVDQREDANPGPRACIRVHRGAERLEWVASRSREEAASPIPKPQPEAE